MSCVMLSFTWVEEIFPPHKPGWFVTPPSLIKGIPSLYQLSFTGGLLELESQKRLASVPAVNALGSIRIFKVSGKTVKTKRKRSLFQPRKKESEKHKNDDNERERAMEKKTEKLFFCFQRGERGMKKSCRSNRITGRRTRKKHPAAGAASTCRKFNQILKISADFCCSYFFGEKFCVLFFRTGENYERYTVAAAS
jgi:hypothetical protein